MSISINSQNAILGWTAKDAQVDLDIGPQNTSNLSISQPKIEIDITNSEISIDNTECLAEQGQKSVERLIKEFSADGKKAVLQGISKRVANGKKAREYIKGNTIGNIAKSNVRSYNHKSFGYGVIPKSKPVINFSDYAVDINVIEGQVVDNGNIAKVNVNYTPYEFDAYLTQKNYINIEYTPELNELI